MEMPRVRDTELLLILENYRANYTRFLEWRSWLYIQDESLYLYTRDLDMPHWLLLDLPDLASWPSPQGFRLVVDMFRFGRLPRSSGKYDLYLSQMAEFYVNEVLPSSAGVTRPSIPSQ